jgi:hypothetical protein
MTTVIITATESYALVGSLGLWNAIQNISNGVLVAIISDTAPDDADKGFLLRPLDGITPATFGDEDVYVKTKRGVGDLAITK